jgi:hypothetical protein
MCQVIKSKGIIDMLELMKVLLFRRYVESTDTNTNNMVVDKMGRVLSVDENPANMPDAFVHKLKIFSKEHEVEFLVKMKVTKFSIHRNEAWIETRKWF